MTQQVRHAKRLERMMKDARAAVEFRKRLAPKRIAVAVHKAVQEISNAPKDAFETS